MNACVGITTCLSTNPIKKKHKKNHNSLHCFRFFLYKKIRIIYYIFKLIIILSDLVVKVFDYNLHRRNYIDIFIRLDHSWKSIIIPKLREEGDEENTFFENCNLLIIFLILHMTFYEKLHCKILSASPALLNKFLVRRCWRHLASW